MAARTYPFNRQSRRRSAISGPTWEDRARRFFSWWLGELANSLPARARHALVAQRPDFEVVLSGTRVSLRQHHGQEWQSLIDEDMAALSGHALGDLAARIRRGGHGRTLAVVRLDHGEFLRRTIALPAAAAENLAEVIGFEMDRYTPFKAADVYFDFRVIGDNPHAKQIRVDLAVARRDVADRALDVARSFGLEPVRLGLTGESADGDEDFDLLPARANRRAQPVRQAIVTGLAIVFIGLGATALYLPLHQKQDLLAERNARLAEVRAEAQRAKDVGAQVDGMVRYAELVYAHRQGRPTATEVLDEVTDILPDDTWIHRFRLDGDALTLSGFSARPSALIALLEDSSMLSGVQFTGAVRPDPRVGLDAFSLKAAVVRRGE